MEIIPKRGANVQVTRKLIVLDPSHKPIRMAKLITSDPSTTLSSQVEFLRQTMSQKKMKKFAFQLVIVNGLLPRDCDIEPLCTIQSTLYREGLQI